MLSGFELYPRWVPLIIRTLYLLRLGNDNTCHVIVKYAHLMLQKRKQILNQESN